MTLNVDIVLPLLLAAIFANTLVMAYVVLANRRESRRSSTTAREAAVQRTLSASYVDSRDRMPRPAAVPVMPRSDPLPEGFLDAAAFRAQVALEDERLRRYRHPTAIVVIELEGLDRLTDRLGAAAAERVVPALADTIRRLARSADIAARLEPGRFVVLLPETDEVAAINYVERVRRACDLWLESGAMAMRLVFGWASTTGELSLPETEQVALQRMYLAARRDRGREDLPAPVAIEVAAEADEPAADAAATVSAVG